MADAFPRSFRQRLLSLLSQSSHVSAPFISTFLLIHLCAPVVANVGGSSLSSQVMLLGREYYQTNFGEQYLVLGPLAVHALSGIVRHGSSPKPSTIFQRICSALPSTTLSSSAYTALLILPIHFGIHRILPTTPNPPVLSLGPSELDYSFVQYGLQRWPARTWAMYLVLVVAVITHAIEGSRVLMATQKPSNNFVVPNNSKIYRRLLAVALTLPILSGLYVLYKEPLYLFSDMGRRFEGAYRLSWIYSSQ
ncbi:hypothetical protein DFH05DRAFT_1405578 [Lentinula detonsa]|uniref:Mitochondrial adapter protein MCP1 transmembrane domain-containing protein n=1 Tax=Lentinula detonsa TaxID=2804962 RepID=A0A9W8NTQ6_9AGAR|nr:hypothetical protein DFH05DRAFT_1405578 [Lentinula detonsa]